MEPTDHDRTDIIELTHRYCWALDDRDWDALAELFTADATARLGSHECADRSAIVDRCRAALDPLDASHHMVTNHLIEVDGDTATARCYLQAQHTKRGTDGGDNWLLGGRYLDRLRRTEHGWRIEHRDLHTSWTDGNVAVFE